MTKDTGGAAFPTGNEDGGLTKRDWFAGQALAGFLASPLATPAWITERAAVSAYRIADAMLAERVK